MTEEILRFIHSECSESERTEILNRAKSDADFAEALKKAREFDDFLKSQYSHVKSVRLDSLKKPHKRSGAFVYRFLKAAVIPVAAVGVFGFAAYSLFLESKNARGYNPDTDAKYVPMYIDISNLGKHYAKSQQKAHSGFENLGGGDLFDKKIEVNFAFTPSFSSDLFAPEHVASKYLKVPFKEPDVICICGVNAHKIEVLPPFKVKNYDVFEMALADYERDCKANIQMSKNSTKKILVSIDKRTLSVNIADGDFDMASTVQKILTKEPKAQNFRRVENLLKTNFITKKDSESLFLLSEFYLDKRNPSYNLELSKKCKELAELSR